MSVDERPSDHSVAESQRNSVGVAYASSSVEKRGRFPLCDKLARLGSSLFHAPIVLIWILERNSQYFASTVGVTEEEASRFALFCAHALDDQVVTIALNTLDDERFRDAPLVTGSSHIRFCAGAVIANNVGRSIGSYCILDTRPKAAFGSNEKSLLSQLAALTVDALKLCTAVPLVPAERQLAIANERYVLATRATTDGIWDWNCTTGQVFYSGRWRAVVGLKDEEHWSDLDDWLTRLHPDDAAEVRRKLGQLQASEMPFFESEYRFRHESGGWRWILNRGTALRDQSGKLIRLVGAITDVTRSKVEDPLTGLHSRASLLNALEESLRTDVEHERKFALLLISLDRFKRINESLGHEIGDSVLIEAGHRMETTVAANRSSIVARVAGDEFAILLDGIAHMEDALTYAYCVQFLLEQPMKREAQEIRVSASIGIAMGDGSYQRSEHLLHDADMAMHQAKVNGRAQSAIFGKRLREQAKLRMTLESELRKAIDRNELLLHYQPKVALGSKEVVGFEALIRWQHPTRGMVPPSDFISLAEETDLILEIGRWTLREAIHQLSEWRSMEMINPLTTIAVNLSARQFGDRQLVENIVRKLEVHQLPASSLELEVTEGILIADADGALQVLQQLKDVGIGLDLDDFGTGYSSLSYLRRFPFDSLKIDRSFIEDIDSNEDAAAIVQAIVALGQALKLRIIAEGVETTEQARKVHSMGCQFGQGYLFSRPMAAPVVTSFLKRRHHPTLMQVQRSRKLHRVA